MFIVTGGAGFIGSNLVAGLADMASEKIVVVDDLSNGRKCLNITDLAVDDYLDKDDFLTALDENRFASTIKAIFHQGACSRTDEWDGRFMMRNNVDYSKRLLAFCVNRSVPLIYASSAAVYGGNSRFHEDSENENPLNPYGFSKLMFDRYLRSLLPLPDALVTGLRYFNVYGPREQHKKSMASVVYHFDGQCRTAGRIRLFAGSGGYADGEQRRDFIHVDDIVAINTWAYQSIGSPRIFNVGTGVSRSFNDVAQQVIDFHDGNAQIEYIPFPDRLRGAYQHTTQADLTRLRDAGCEHPFMPIEEGIPKYLQLLRHGAPATVPDAVLK